MFWVYINASPVLSGTGSRTAPSGVHGWSPATLSQNALLDLIEAQRVKQGGWVEWTGDLKPTRGIRANTALSGTTLGFVI